jgi:hypothetical protein
VFVDLEVREYSILSFKDLHLECPKQPSSCRDGQYGLEGGTAFVVGKGTTTEGITEFLFAGTGNGCCVSEGQQLSVVLSVVGHECQ